MPVALGIGVTLFGETAFVVFLWFARAVFLGALLTAFEAVLPSVLARAFRGILLPAVRAIERPLSGWLDDHLRPLTAFLVEVRLLTTSAWGVVGPFAARVAGAVETVVEDTIPEAIRARTAALRLHVSDLDLLLTGTLVGGVLGVVPSLAHLYERLFDATAGELPILRRRLNALRAATVALAAVTLDRVYGGVTGLPGAVDHLFDDVVPALRHRLGQAEAVLGGVTDVALPDLRGRLGALRGEWDEVAPWVKTVTAAVSAGAAVEVFRRVVKCGSKLDRLCSTDEDVLADLLGTLLVIGAFPGITALAEEAADLLRASIDDVVRLVE